MTSVSKRVPKGVRWERMKWRLGSGGNLVKEKSSLKYSMDKAVTTDTLQELGS